MPDTDPATAQQVGAVHGQFRRLGLDDRWLRDERLAVSAQLLGLEAIDSTKSLSAGDAGRLIRILSRLDSAEELAAAIPKRAASRPARRRGRSTLPPVAIDCPRCESRFSSRARHQMPVHCPWCRHCIRVKRPAG